MSTELTHLHPLIIPTVVIPFAAALAGLSALASVIAGFFGITLKAEGPKKLLEVLLKPKVLFTAALVNLVLYGGYKAHFYWKNLPVSLARIEDTNSRNNNSDRVYRNSDLPMILKTALTETTDIQGTFQLLGRHHLKGGSFRGVQFSGPSVFIGTHDGKILEVDSTSAEVVREFFIGTAVAAAPNVIDGFLFSGEGTHDTHKARVYKFDLKTGNLVGTFTAEGHIEGMPVGADWKSKSYLAVPGGKGGVSVIDRQTMNLVWNAKDGHIDSSSEIVEDRLFVGTGLEKENLGAAKGMALAYNLETGKKLWQRELPGSSWMRPVSHKNQVCFVFGEVYFQSDLGGIYCFDQLSGQPTIAFNNAAPIVSIPQKVENDIVTSDIYGKVCRLSLETGQLRWCTETTKSKMALGNPIVDLDRKLVIYANQADGLFALNLGNGKMIDHWKPDMGKNSWGKTYAPIAKVNDQWWVIDMKGNLLRFSWSSSKPTSLTANR